MKRNTLYLALAVFGMSISLASCGNSPAPEGGGHTHHFSERWSYDDEYHWHACDGCDEKSDKARHNLESTWVDPTYEEGGHYEYRCAVCGYSHKGEAESDPLQHHYSDSYEHDENGHWQRCTDRGYEELTTPVESHTFGDWTIDYEPTDTVPGLKHRDCFCGYTDYDEIPTVEHVHTFADYYVYDNTHHWHPATCGHNDQKSGYAEHDFRTTVHEPTYSDGGYTYYECTVCGYSYNGDYTNPKEHTYSNEYSHDRYSHWRQCTDEGYEDNYIDYGEHQFPEEWTIDVETTESTDGHQYKQCSVCGYKIEETIESPLAHSIRCLNFELNDEEDGYKVTGWKSSYNDNPEYLIIPQTYNDLPVVEIEDNARIDEIKSLKLNEGLKRIGERGFYNHNLKSVTLPSTVEELGNDAFYSYNGALEVVNLNDGLLKIGSSALRSEYGKAIPSLTIPSSVTEIGYRVANVEELTWNADNVTTADSSAYYSYYAFTVSREVVFGNEVTTINGYSVDGEAKFLTLGTGVTDINDNAIHCQFYDITNHSSLVLEKGSDSYSGIAKYAVNINGEKGTIYEESGFKLYNYGTETIAYEYRYSGEYIVEIPNGVTYIKSGLFDYNYEYKQLYQLVIPKTVKYAEHNSICVRECFSVICESESIDLNDVLYQCNKLLETVSSKAESKLVFLEEYSMIAFEDSIIKYYGEYNDVCLPSGYKIVGESAFRGMEVKSITIPEGYEEIKTSALSLTYRLTTISLPESLKIIGSWAFYSSPLTSIDIPAGVEKIGASAFAHSSLTSLDLSKLNLKVIPNNMVEYCSDLKTVKLPETVVEIGDNAFQYCYALENVNIPDSLMVFGDSVFHNSELVGIEDVGNGIYAGNENNPYKVLINVKSGATELTLHDDCEFMTYMTGLSGYYGTVTTLTIGKGLKYIGPKVLEYSKVTKINYGAEALRKAVPNDNYSYVSPLYCNLVTEINILDGVKSLPDYVFNKYDGSSNYTNLTKFTLPGSLEKVTSTSIVINVNNIETHEYEGNSYIGCESSPYVYLAKVGDSSSTSQVIHEDCRFIGPKAFYQSQITSIELPSELRGILDFGFAVSKLTDISFPSKLNFIGVEAFRSVTGLVGKTITLPQSIEYVGERAFIYSEASTISINNDNYRTMCSGTVLVDRNRKAIVLSMAGFRTTVTTLEIGEDIELICEMAFYDNTIPNTKLTTIRMAKQSVKKIDDFAFGYCEALTSVTLSENLDEMVGHTFYYDYELKEIEIPETMQKFTYSIISYDKCFVLVHAKNENLIRLSANIEKVIIGYERKYDEGNYNYYLNSFNAHKYATIYAFTGDTFNPPEYVLEDYKVWNVTSDVITNNTGLKKLYIQPGVTSVGGYQDALFEEVYIPSTVTEIESNAFKSCRSLKTVSIPSSVKTIGSSAFAFCESLTSITLPDGLEDLGVYAFNGCTSLESINIPGSLKVVREYAFAGCTSLDDVTLNEGTVTIQGEAFVRTAITSVTLPDSIQYVYKRSFPIEAHTVEGDIAYLGKGSNPHYFACGAFANSSSFHKASADMVLHSDTKVVMGYGFENNNGFDPNYKVITLNEGLEHVCYEAFISCKVNDIPSTLKVVDDHAFQQTTFTNNDLVLNLDKIGERAFYRTAITSVTFLATSELETTGSQAFLSCNKLTSVDMSKCSKLRRIDDYTFQSCTALETVKLPETLVSIGLYAFASCNKLTEIYLPASVTAIDENAFNSLKKIYYGGSENDKKGWDYYFNSGNSVEIVYNYVPE